MQTNIYGYKDYFTNVEENNLVI